MIPPGIFFECCTRMIDKYDVSRPFYRDGWLYATNGRILVRSRIDPQDVGDLNTGRKLPNPMRIIESTEGLVGQPVPLPEADEFEPCSLCDGLDNFRCPDCHGEGRVLAEHGVPIHDDPEIRLAAHYVAMLRRHGVSTVNVFVSPDGTSQQVEFEGPDFEGCLMPVADDDDDDQPKEKASMTSREALAALVDQIVDEVDREERADCSDDQLTGGFDLKGCYRLDENRRVGKRKATRDHMQEALQEDPQSIRKQEDYRKLAPFWGTGMTKEQAVAAYEADKLQG
jgi:hypothetical protein